MPGSSRSRPKRRGRVPFDPNPERRQRPGGHRLPPIFFPGDRQDRYAIQIRAYPEDQKQNALTFLEDVRKRARDVTMETVSIAGRGVWHRILLGDFSTIEEAAAYQKSDRVAREYPYGFIQRKYGSSAYPFPRPAIRRRRAPTAIAISGLLRRWAAVKKAAPPAVTHRAR